MPGAEGGQKKVSDPYETGITDGCEHPREWWKLNTGPVREPPLLSITKIPILDLFF